MFDWPKQNFSCCQLNIVSQISQLWQWVFLFTLGDGVWRKPHTHKNQNRPNLSRSIFIWSLICLIGLTLCLFLHRYTHIYFYVCMCKCSSLGWTEKKVAQGLRLDSSPVSATGTFCDTWGVTQTQMLPNFPLISFTLRHCLFVGYPLQVSA